MNKDYFKKWIAIQTKMNTPFILVWFLWEVFKICTFGFFDSMLVWYENDLVDSADRTCSYSTNASCVQHLTSYIEGVCSQWVVYSLACLLLVINIIEILRDLRNCVSFLSCPMGTFTPLGKKKPLTHAYTYYILANVATASVILNVSLRLIRHFGWLQVPQAIDSVTYFLIYFGFIWTVLFFVQLLPYFGFLAIVMKLMMRDTLIFLVFIIVSAAPYIQLFPRIINHKTPLEKCDPEWVDSTSSIYSTFLLLFNMKNFANVDEGDASKTTQLHVSRKFA